MLGRERIQEVVSPGTSSNSSATLPHCSHSLIRISRAGNAGEAPLPSPPTDLTIPVRRGPLAGPCRRVFVVQVVDP